MASIPTVASLTPATIPPATSMCESTQPPKISPDKLASWQIISRLFLKCSDRAGLKYNGVICASGRNFQRYRAVVFYEMGGFRIFAAGTIAYFQSDETEVHRAVAGGFPWTVACPIPPIMSRRGHSEELRAHARRSRRNGQGGRTSLREPAKPIDQVSCEAAMSLEGAPR